MDEIDRALAALGNSAVLGEDVPDLEIMPTESTALNDDVLACGGLPRGRAIEIFSKPSVGKSTFAQWLAGQVQKQEWEVKFRDGSSVTRAGTVCWFDAERSLLKDYAQGSGMNLRKMILPDFGLGNDMLYKLKQCIALDAFDLIVVDSIQAVIPDSVADIQGSRSMKDKLQASVMWAQFFQELQGGYKIRDANSVLIKSKSPEYVYVTGKDDDDDDEPKSKKKTAAPKETRTTNIHRLGSKKCCLIFINHARVKIQIGGGGKSFGGPTTYTPGGEEKNFAFSTRLELKPKGNKMGTLKGGKVLKYKEIEIRSTKNKLGTPLRAHNFFLGIDGRLMLDESDLNDIELDLGPDEEDKDEEEQAIEEKQLGGGASLESIKERMAQLKEEKDGK